MAGDSPTSPQIFTYLDGRIPVRCHDHVAVVHRGGDSATRGTEFLREGLSRGDWCCCRAPSESRARLTARFRESGFEVKQPQERRMLQLPPEPPSMGDWLKEAKRFFAQAEAAHAPGVRWLEEGVWTRTPGKSTTRFFELHSQLNYLVKQYPSVALCFYDSEHLETPELFSAIAVHRHLLVNDTLVRDNPFYIPAEKYLALSQEERGSDLREIYREVGFDLERLLATLAGYGRLQKPGE